MNETEYIKDQIRKMNKELKIINSISKNEYRLIDKTTVFYLEIGLLIFFTSGAILGGIVGF